MKEEIELLKKKIFNLESDLEDTSTKKLNFERDIRRLEEKNKDLNQKVEDLLEDIEESELLRANEKRSLNRMKINLEEQKKIVRKQEGEIIQLEMKLDEIKSHDKILLKERNDYSDSKFSLEGKLRTLEQKNNQNKKEYLEILQVKEDLEVKILELEETILKYKKTGSENQMDMVFLKKILLLAGKGLIFLT